MAKKGLLKWKVGCSLMLGKRNSGFTTVELMISISVGLLIILLMSSSFGQNVLNIKESSRLNDLEYGKHFLMKEIYLNLINMNSRLTINNGDVKSSKINFITFTEKKGGLYEKIVFDYHPYKDISKGIKTVYYKDEKNRFVRERDGKVKFLMENLLELNFSYLNRMIYCDGTFYSEKDGKTLERDFRFGIFAGYDHVGVKFE